MNWFKAVLCSLVHCTLLNWISVNKPYDCSIYDYRNYSYNFCCCFFVDHQMTITDIGSNSQHAICNDFNL